MNTAIRIFICFIVFFCGEVEVGKGQNLVPNGSFEVYSLCPYNVNEILITPPWFGSDSPDYFNTCATNPIVGVPNNSFGSQYPLAGNAYCGIYGYHSLFLTREYVIVQLTSTLATAHSYCVNFSINLSDSSRYSISNMGLYISDTLPTVPNDYCYSNLTPQIVNPPSNLLNDTINWQPIGGTYIAHGGENYIIIGNFNQDSTTIIQYEHPTSLSIAGSYYYIDDVSVIDCTSVGIEEWLLPEIQLFPNPATTTFTITSAATKIKEIKIINVLGQCAVLPPPSLQGGGKGVVVDVSSLFKGIYFVQIQDEDRNIINKKIVIN